MKQLYLVRHAKSSWSNPGLKDIDRPLNSRGERDAPFMGKMLASKGVKPDLIISSPARRAHKTAKFFAKAMGIDKKNIALDERIYDAFPEDIFEIVREINDENQTVLLFGHNPTFTSFVNRFTNKFIDNIPTCGISGIVSKAATWEDFATTNSELKEFYYPKQYFD
ncbi:MAG: phosphohistidine phosphatase SixA [Saprospiraceae bacterium]|nr:MAG: phosphohistidine phosphatase SixA [Saprospiraceae bacterium]